MNAYELADELDKINDIPIETIINMLRQQAERIAELEKSHIELERGIVADLNQRQSAEPFIWLKQDFDGEWIEVHPNKGIPLYTAPQIKELSDEEIERIYYKTLNRFDFARAILKKASEQ